MMDRYLRTLIRALAGVGLLHVTAGLVIAIVGRVMPIPGVGHDYDPGFLGTMEALSSLLLLATGAGSLTAAVLLHRKHRFGPIAGIASSFALLIAPPFGTLVGSFGIWVLFNPDADSSGNTES